MVTLSDKITGMPFVQVNDRSMVNFMQKPGTNVPNKIMSSNNFSFYLISIQTHSCHTLELRISACIMTLVSLKADF